jgi:hypothetical protein
MRATPNRPVSETEAACISLTLERAPAIADASALIAAIGNLRVIGGCDCGCASVDFENDSSEHSRPIADGIGKTARGGDVGVIVWGTSNAITGLEIYGRGAGDDDLNLPELNSIASWDHPVA